MPGIRKFYKIARYAKRQRWETGTFIFFATRSILRGKNKNTLRRVFLLNLIRKKMKGAKKKCERTSKAEELYRKTNRIEAELHLLISFYRNHTLLIEKGGKIIENTSKKYTESLLKKKKKETKSIQFHFRIGHRIFEIPEPDVDLHYFRVD